MKRLPALLSALALSAIAATTAPALPPDTPLVVDGTVKVDVLDLDAYLLRIPENMRGTVRASYDRVASLVDQVFLTRTAAAGARKAGLDKDPAVQRRLQQVQEAFLADLYMQKLQSEVDKMDLTARARELYLADPEKFKTPEAVYVEQIFVSLNGRTRDLARVRADQAMLEAKQAGDKQAFLQVAAKYSDDPDKQRNGGDLGYYSPTHFASPVAAAIAAMSTKGQIAGPIETETGFYIERFEDRTAPRLAKFEEVRDKLAKEERERLKKERVDQYLAEVRNSKTVIIDTKNVESYVQPVDVPKSMAAPAAKPAGAPPPEMPKPAAKEPAVK